MPKKIIIVLLFFALFSKSQPYTVIKGKEFDVSDKKTSFLVIEADDNSFYMLRRKSNSEEPVLCRFDIPSASLQYEKKIEMKSEEVIIEAYNRNGKVILLSSIIEKKAHKELFLLRIINTVNGEMMGNVKVLEEIDTKNDNGGYWYFRLYFSPDNKKMMALLSEKTAEGPRKSVAKLYDTDNFKKIWEKQPVETFENSYAYSSDFMTDNDGRFIYLMAYLRAGSSDNIIYAVCLSSANNTTNQFIKVPSDNKTTLNLNLEQLENGLVCTGEFLDGTNTAKEYAKLATTGFFALTIDTKEATTKGQSYDYLSPELQGKLTYKAKNPVYKLKGIKKDNKLFKHFHSFYIDGALYVVKYHGYDYTLSGSNSTMRYHYGREIIVLKYGSDKKLEWMQIIPRNAVEVEGYGNTNVLQMTGTKELHLVYYDRDKNLQTFPDVNVYDPAKYKGIMAFSNKTWPVCVTLSKNGTLKREIIKGTGENEVELWDLEENAGTKKNNLILSPKFDKKNVATIDILTINE